MGRKSKILLTLLLVSLAIQFIRPEMNKSTNHRSGDLMESYNIPTGVAETLKESCYDCHSNNTRYPWYFRIQPTAWILARHIKEGKEEINFDEFTTYSKRRQLSKFKATQNSIKDGSRPLKSYVWLHPEAKMSTERKALVLNWLSKAIDSISGARKIQ